MDQSLQEQVSSANVSDGSSGRLCLTEAEISFAVKTGS